jgi:DNA-binding HxlR family transcriptional regulator
MKNQSNGAMNLQEPTAPEENGHVCDAAHALPRTRAAMRLLTGKWKGEIIWSLRDGKLRFGELLRAIPGITQHMLTTQLRDLESHGLVARTVYAEVPPRVEYELTEAARDLRPVFDEIMNWAQRHGDSFSLTAEEDDAESLKAPTPSNDQAGRTAR